MRLPAATPTDDRWSTGHSGTRIRTTRADPLLQVTLWHPPVNALDLAGYDELASAFTAADRDAGVRAVVLRGHGRHFCAGQDHREAPKLAACTAEYLERAAAAVEAVAMCRHPVVAAVTGAAVGVGLILACSADVLIVAEDSTLSLPETRRGVIAGHAHLRHLAGDGLARVASLTGQAIPPRLLEASGVKVTRSALVPSVAAEVAADLACLPASVTRATKAGWLADRAKLMADYRLELAHTVQAGALGLLR